MMLSHMFGLSNLPCFCSIADPNVIARKRTLCTLTPVYPSLQGKSVRDVDTETKPNPELRQGNHITQNMASPEACADIFFPLLCENQCFIQCLCCFISVV